MIDNVRFWQEAVSEGFFIKRALLAMFRTLELGFRDDLLNK